MLFLVLILISRCQICFGLQTGCTDVTLERVFWGKLVCNASLKVNISSQRAGLISFLTVTNLFLSLSTCNCSCVEVIACIIAYHVFSHWARGVLCCSHPIVITCLCFAQWCLSHRSDSDGLSKDLDDVTVLRRKGLTACSVTVLLSQCC